MSRNHVDEAGKYERPSRGPLGRLFEKARQRCTTAADEE